MSGGEPVAVALNMALPPDGTVWLAGCVEMAGASPTLKTAMLLVTEP